MRIQVEEIQGDYGNLAVSEHLVQKIWLRQDFNTRSLCTLEGKTLEIITPGTPNSLEGPDFRNAVFRMDGQSIAGDVEIHLYAKDWNTHDHSSNPDFANVRLHVIVFPPSQPPSLKTLDGHQPETLVLLPLLNVDLETYALEEALRHPDESFLLGLAAPYMERPVYERRRDLRLKARYRWEQKLRQVHYLLKEEKWEEVCHQQFMEALGYRRNRAAMRELACRYPISEIACRNPGDLYREMNDVWKLAGLRPANHPLKRLKQYLDMLRVNPDWPLRLAAYCFPEGDMEPETSAARKRYRLKQIHDRLQNTLFAMQFSGTRFETLMVDVCLPLLAVERNKEFFGLWYHWWGGDVPEQLSRFIDLLEIRDQRNPFCNGLNQASLQMILEQRPTA